MIEETYLNIKEVARGNFAVGVFVCGMFTLVSLN